MEEVGELGGNAIDLVREFKKEIRKKEKRERKRKSIKSKSRSV